MTLRTFFQVATGAIVIAFGCVVLILATNHEALRAVFLMIAAVGFGYLACWVVGGLLGAAYSMFTGKDLF